MTGEGWCDWMEPEGAVAHEDIDEEFRPVVKALNDVGLRTTQSCCGHGGKKDRYISIDLEEVKEMAVRQNARGGKRLVLWW